MAKKKTTKRADAPKERAGGPYLAAAFFCEGTSEDKNDGAITVFRIVDHITVHLDPSTPEDVPSEAQRIPVSISGFISLKSGEAPGEHKLLVAAESPAGKRRKLYEKAIQLSPKPNGGFNLRLSQTILVEKGGLFWLDIVLDGRLLTRMPLKISIQRTDLQPG